MSDSNGMSTLPRWLLGEIPNWPTKNSASEPCRKVLVSLNEHWSGLTLFIDHARIPWDKNYGERLIRGRGDWPQELLW